jgi:hypothetical protein
VELTRNTHMTDTIEFKLTIMMSKTFKICRNEYNFLQLGALCKVYLAADGVECLR